MTWREVARYPLRDVVLLPHVHVGRRVYQAREHRNLSMECDYCGDCDDTGMPIDSLLFVAAHWLTEECEPYRLKKMPDMNQHGEFVTDWLHPHRVRQVGDLWDVWVVVEELVRGLHPVDEYEASAANHRSS